MGRPQNSNRLAKDKRNQTTEYGFGEGMVPPGKEYAPPSEGGMYRPKAPNPDEPTRRR
ncbi:MAG: hypothetical protein ACSLE7_11120 [Mycobacterium sp.]|jgi:hypothetical protein